VILQVASKNCFCQRCRSSYLVEVDGWRVDVAKRVLLKPHQRTSKVSAIKLSCVPKKILQELEGSQFAAEVLKSRGFSRVAFVDLGSFLPSSSLTKSSNLDVTP
jgi:hypothetical protein